MSIKRNATAVLPVEVGIPVDDIQSMEFLFKKEKNPKSPELLKKKYQKDEIEIAEGSSNENGFTMWMKLKPKETFCLTAGKVYMDTQVVLTDGTLPQIPIVPIDDILETLFEEVYGDDGKG